MGAAVVGGALVSLGIGEAAADPGGCKRNGKSCKNDDSAVAKTATVSVTPALLRVERMAQPAIAALSAVAASARVACALSLVFRRMLFPASQVTWRLAAALEAPAAVSENLLVEATAPAGALVFPVQPPATVRQDSSAR